MNNKKSRLFLWVSLALFALSAIAVFISIIASYCQIGQSHPGDNISGFMEFIALFAYVCLMIPVLGSELSFIRSVYKILKHKPTGVVKICYLISAILSFSVLVFLCLIYVGLINFDGNNAPIDSFILTEWLFLIVSLVLGSIHKKNPVDATLHQVDQQSSWSCNTKNLSITWSGISYKILIMIGWNCVYRNLSNIGYFQTAHILTIRNELYYQMQSYKRIYEKNWIDFQRFKEME